MLDGNMSEHHNAYMRQWKRDNREKVNAINRAVKAKRPELYRAINRISMAKMRAERPAQELKNRNAYRDKDPQRYLLNHAKHRAKRREVAFDLALEDIVIPEFCPVLGMRLQFGNGKLASLNHASPSIDRMDCTKGYVKGNVYVISNRANHLKNNASVEELEAIVAYMRRHHVAP